MIKLWGQFLRKRVLKIINIDHFRPVNVPLDIFSEEIQFYELGESAINKFRFRFLFGNFRVCFDCRARQECFENLCFSSKYK